MGQGDLPRPGDGAAADQRHRRGGVVGRAEGPAGDEGRPGVGEPRHRIDLRGLHGLLVGHIRQDGGQTPGQHGLAGAGGADEQHVVPAGRGDLQRPLHVLLAHHVGKVGEGRRGPGGLPGACRLHGLLAPEMAHQLSHVPDAVDGEPLGQRGLGGVGLRHVQLPDAGPGGAQGHGQHARHGPQSAGEAQLAQEGGALRQLLQLLRCAEDAQQDGQVVESALLAEPGRGQVDGDAADGEFGAAVLDGGPDPLPGLPRGGVGQTHHVEGGQSAGEKALHADLVAADAAQAQRTHRHHHVSQLPSL